MKVIQFIERTENVLGDHVERLITLPIDNIAHLNEARLKEKNKRKWNEKEYHITSKYGYSWTVDEQTFKTCKDLIEQEDIEIELDNND